MLVKTLLPGLVALASALSASARPQVTTALPFGVVDDSGPIEGPGGDGEIVSGVIVGAGADGTTYVLSVPATATDDTGFTVTLVENASAASVLVVASDDGVVATEILACGFGSDGSAVCTQEAIAAGDSTTFSDAFTTSGPADHVTVVVSTSSGANAGAGSGSGSGSDPTGATSAPLSTNTQPSAARKTAVAGFSGAVFVVLAAFALV